MPALTDLDRRLAENAIAQARFERNTATAAEVAKKVPLVHGIEPDELQAFLSELPTHIPTTADARCCSDRTREAEDELGLGRCVYLYAGKGHPDFGEVAMAFAPECENGHSGSATPFDTGGLRTSDGSEPPIRPRLSSGTLRDFCQNAMIQLIDWRKEFGRFLAAYFEPLAEYWNRNGRPVADFPDPEDIFTEGTGDWRRWVFEIRFHEAHSLREHKIAWARTRQTAETLRRMVAAEREGPELSPVQVFVQQGVQIDSPGRESVAAELTRWVMQQLEL